MFITYEEYKSNGGKMSPEAFPKLERKARSTIQYFTFGRVQEPVSDEIKECMYDLIDFAEQVERAVTEGSKAIESERVGNHSINYASGIGLLGIQTSADKGKDKSELEYEIVAKHLLNTGLMYRGIYDDDKL